MTQIIHLISGPRNISTALMYSFRSRLDTSVIDEPFYACYLQKTGASHPGRLETLASMSHEPQHVISCLNERIDSNFLFVKNMAHHLIGLDWNFFKEYKNLFLIRDPKSIISSFVQVIDNPTMLDIGLELELEIFRFLEKIGNQGVVLDSDELLKNPEIILKKVCDRLDIPYFDSMLQWSTGPKPEDGVWAPYWYKNVHRSSGFVKQLAKERELPDHCLDLYHQALEIYEILLSKSIKA